jgi:hypothetical protein
VLFNRNFGAFCFFISAAPLLHSQAKATAKRDLDLQVGGGFVLADSDYISPKLRGGFVYADLDKTIHWGGEFELHQANSSQADHTYERTYEVGARYHRTYGIVVPYVKALIGRGVFNYPGEYNQLAKTYGPSIANLAYNMYAGAIGADFKIKPYLNVRADYEYQRWHNFPPNGLTPQLFTIGVAYHFPGELDKHNHRH